jgi:hypothetical protein
VRRSVNVEHGPQLTDRVMKSGPRSPDRNPEGRRDLHERVPKVVVEDDDGPMFRRQPAERLLECLPIDDGVRRIGRNAPDFEDAEFRRPAARPSRFDVTSVDDKAVEPCLEPLRIAERGQVAPRIQQPQLRGVLGSKRVAKDPVGKSKAAVDVIRREGRERVFVAACGPDHDLALTHVLILG